ncbi:MAG: VWA domain-containing protein, partial [Planctomycetota bacterium]
MRIGRLRLVRPRTLLAVGLLTLALGVTALLPGVRTLEAKVSGPPSLRVALVDVSASRARTEGAAGEYERYVRHALLGFAKRAAEAEEQVGVVAFAESANVLFGPGDPEQLVQRLEGRGGHSPLRPRASEGRDSASRLDAALQVFEEALSPANGRPGTLELFLRQGGGEKEDAFFEAFFEGPDPTPRLAQLRDRGVRVLDGDALTLEEGRGSPPAPAVDVCVRSLALPERVSTGERLALRTEIAYRGNPSGQRGEQVVLVRARRIGEDREAAWTSLSHRFVTAGRGEVQLESLVLDLEPVGAGRCEVQLEVALLDEAGRTSQDAFPENDVMRATTRVGDSLTGVVLAPLAEHALFESLQSVEGIELVLLDVESPGGRDQLARQLSQSDFVCLSNTTLGDRDQGVPSRELVTFVEKGGGLFVFSGWRTLTAWPNLEAQEPGTAWSLLPLVPAVDRREARDIVFLVDGSGSMRGEPIERVRRALFELAAGAPANDWMDLYFFTGALTSGLVLSGGEEGETSKDVRRERLRRLLDARVPGGSTQILTSLEQLAIEREKVPLAQRREALIFLLSDGRELDPFRVVERSEALRKRFAEGRARLVPIAVGEDPALGFLRRLVPA